MRAGILLKFHIRLQVSWLDFNAPKRYLDQGLKMRFPKTVPFRLEVPRVDLTQYFIQTTHWPTYQARLYSWTVKRVWMCWIRGRGLTLVHKVPLLSISLYLLGRCGNWVSKPFFSGANTDHSCCVDRHLEDFQQESLAGAAHLLQDNEGG